MHCAACVTGCTAFCVVTLTQRGVAGGYREAVYWKAIRKEGLAVDLIGHFLDMRSVAMVYGRTQYGCAVAASRRYAGYEGVTALRLVQKRRHLHNDGQRLSAVGLSSSPRKVSLNSRTVQSFGIKIPDRKRDSQ